MPKFSNPFSSAVPVSCILWCILPPKHKSFHIEAHLFWHRDFDGLSRLFCWGTRYDCSHGSTMSIVQSRFNLLLTSIAFFPKNFTSKSFTLILISRPRNSYQTTLHSLWTRKWNVCSKSRYLEFNQIVSADASILCKNQKVTNCQNGILMPIQVINISDGKFVVSKVK